MNKHATIETGSLEARMANAVRALTMDAVERAGSGHPGMPMGMADAATVLFNRFVTVDPSDPGFPDRDRFVLSAGHGSMLLYAIHHLLGHGDMDAEQLRRFRQARSRTPGHPEYGQTAGVEMTTGPLGQGLATAVGMALGERMMNARFNDDLVDHYTYVIAGDGCLMEGISHEATDLAGHLGLGRLIVLWDDNAISIDGATSLATSMDQKARFAAAGWHVLAVDGHDHEAVAAAIENARHDPRPSLIACKTVIGFSAPGKQGTAAAHGAPLGSDEIAAARKALDWPFAPFEVPDDIAGAWRRIAARGAEKRAAWQARLEAGGRQTDFEAALARPDETVLRAVLGRHKRAMSAQAPKLATRLSSQMALEAVNAVLPAMVGGSADLTGSNNTRTSAMRTVTRQDYSGNYIHYGVREHAMAAAMNGLALHGGFRPYGGTFLVFADYCRPAIRLSALMGLPVVYVMTHDSIGLGEDGPTHQPVEHLASLRAMPNVNVFRPADAVETAEAWEVALSTGDRPTILCLSRQALATVRKEHFEENLSARGAYVLREANGDRDITFMATGSEVQTALQAAELLAERGVKAAVVSAPCLDLFAVQDPAYRRSVLGLAPRLAVEAGVEQGWEGLIGESGAFIGMRGFGASAPAQALFEEFGITAERAAATALVLLDAAASGQAAAIPNGAPKQSESGANLTQTR